tara:strand:+ start:394 stop:528 length:135 start_codon:yes stop_codon:yes gene_type:complete
MKKTEDKQTTTEEQTSPKSKKEYTFKNGKSVPRWQIDDALNGRR